MYLVINLNFLSPFCFQTRAKYCIKVCFTQILCLAGILTFYFMKINFAHTQRLYALLNIKNLYSEINYIQGNSVCSISACFEAFTLLHFAFLRQQFNTWHCILCFKTQIENSIQVWKCHLQY